MRMRAMRNTIGITLSCTSIHAYADAPLNYFLHADGPAASPTMRLGWALAVLVTVVAVIVTGLLVGAMLRKRPPPTEEDSKHLKAASGGLHWVWIGTALSSVGLFAALAYTLVTLESVASPHRPTELTITVTAYDWWWKIEYPGKPAVTTANEIHIPVGEPVKVELKSADVIHAFWVPRLAGKTQTIPGVVNEQWIQADTAGVYRGQCTQFCGAQHAHMAFEVIAQPRAEYDAWLAAQAQAHASNAHADETLRAGAQLFKDRCAGCHMIRGTDAEGQQAPDLTHLNSRRLIAAGTLQNTEANQLDWIRHAQRIKPDSLMPSIPLSADEATVLAAYLRTLQ
jgi:cytochrome c oxidase subunit II